MVKKKVDLPWNRNKPTTPSERTEAERRITPKLKESCGLQRGWTIGRRPRILELWAHFLLYLAVVQEE